MYNCLLLIIGMGKSTMLCYFISLVLLKPLVIYCFLLEKSPENVKRKDVDAYYATLMQGKANLSQLQLAKIDFLNSLHTAFKTSSIMGITFHTIKPSSTPTSDNLIKLSILLAFFNKFGGHSIKIQTPTSTEIFVDVMVVTAAELHSYVNQDLLHNVLSIFLPILILLSFLHIYLLLLTNMLTTNLYLNWVGIDLIQTLWHYFTKSVST